MMFSLNYPMQQIYRLRLVAILESFEGFEVFQHSVAKFTENEIPMILHPWHGVEPEWNREDASIRGLIEIPSGSKAKYEVDKVSGLLKLDRVVFAAFVYPVNYGFIPKSLGDDGDPLDILVLSEVSIEPLCLVDTKVIGYMEMIDSGQGDEKIIAVAKGDMSVSHIQSMEELPQNFKSELKHFFLNYKTLMNREVRVENFRGREDAAAVIEKALINYQKKFA
jgi:inorganic pyrophosphatase